MIYHVYYFAVMGFVILLISPFILFTSYKEERYPAFFKWSRVWGRLTLTLMGYFTIVKRMGKIDRKQQYVVVANHASELDIMMTLAIVPNCFVFIGKKELAKLPLFGYFYKRTNILVDRKSLKSKKEVMVKAQAKMEEGIGLCIFPEGGIPKKSIKLAPFKMGAFKLAIENQKPILPITFPDNKKHFPDFHEGGYPGRLRATIHEPINTEGLTEVDSAELRDRCYKLIDDELTKFGIV